MALKNSYESIALQGYNLDAITSEIDIAVAMKQTVEISKDVHYIVDTAANVPNFPAPIVHDDVVYVDAREFSVVAKDGSLNIRNQIEHQLRFEQASWEKVWTTKAVPHERLLSQMAYHVEIFSKWLGGALTKTYALTPYQETQVMAACSLYAVGQYYNNIEDDITMYRLQEMVAKQLNLNIATYETVTGGLENLFPRGLSELVEMLQQADITPRLKDISTLAIIQALGGSFWGVTQDRVLVSLALEYPPALYAIIVACISNSMFKKTRIGGVVAYAKAGRAHERFLLNYNQVLNQHTAPREAKKD